MEKLERNEREEELMHLRLGRPIRRLRLPFSHRCRSSSRPAFSIKSTLKQINERLVAVRENIFECLASSGEKREEKTVFLKKKKKKKMNRKEVDDTRRRLGDATTY